MTMKDSKGKAKILGQPTEAFAIETGFGKVMHCQQHCSILYGKRLRNIETSSNRTIFKRTRHYIACADDVFIMDDR